MVVPVPPDQSDSTKLHLTSMSVPGSPLPMLGVTDEGGHVDAATGQGALDPSQQEAEGPRREPAEARSPRGRRTRAALVVAGRAVFERDGFIEARITDIAAGAGVSHGTFYTYFASKEEIFREIVSGVQLEMRAHGPGMPPDDDIWGRIEHGNRVYVETYLRNQRIMATLEQVVTFNEEVRQMRRDIRRPFLVRNERAIRRWQEAGLADRALDPRYAASALGAMVDRFMYTWTVLGEPFDQDRAIATLTRLWAGALGIEPPERESVPPVSDRPAPPV
jgi:AcrR family transcriptional regulator